MRVKHGYDISMYTVILILKVKLALCLFNLLVVLQQMSNAC